MTNPFVEKLSAGEWSAERFRQHLEETGAPLVERVLADEVELEARIESQVAELRKEGIDATFKLVSGTAADPAHSIAEVATAFEADVSFAVLDRLCQRMGGAFHFSRARQREVEDKAVPRIAQKQ